MVNAMTAHFCTWVTGILNRHFGLAIGLGCFVVGMGFSCTLYTQAVAQSKTEDARTARDIVSLVATQVGQSIDSNEFRGKPIAFLAGSIELDSLKDCVLRVPRIRSAYILLSNGKSVLKEGFSMQGGQQSVGKSLTEITSLNLASPRIRAALQQSSGMDRGAASITPGDTFHTASAPLLDEAGHAVGLVVVELSREAQAATYRDLQFWFYLGIGVSAAVSLVCGLAVTGLLSKMRRHAEVLSNQVSEQSEMVEVISQSLSTVQELQIETQSAFEKVLSASGTIVYVAWIEQNDGQENWVMHLLHEEDLNRFSILDPEVEGLYQAWASAKYPADHERYEREVQHVLSTGAQQGRIEYRLVLPSGEFKWIREDFYVDYDHTETNRIVGICVDVTAEKQREQQILKLANFNSSTGLCNRNHLPTLLLEVLPTAKTLSAAVVIIENFGLIKRQHGLDFGDRVMKKVADALSDIRIKGAVIAQLGGGEFCVVGSFEAKEIPLLVQELRRVTLIPITIDGSEIAVIPRIGVVMEHPADDVTGIVRRASLAASEALRGSSEWFELYNAALEAAVFKRVQLKADLATALSKDEMFVVYQPIVDLQLNRVTKVEALVRWKHPQDGFISPAEFISLAEASGMIVPITKFVFEQAIKEIQELNHGLKNPLSVSVNISARELRKSDLVERLIEHVKEVHMPPSLVTLEVTETSTMDSFESAFECLNRLHDEGFKIALDDFGSGYSSMGYLSKLPLDLLKIDKSIIDNCDKSGKAFMILMAVCNVAEGLGLEILCEGVETEAQLKVLGETKTRYVQGYYFSKPLAYSDLREFMAKDLSNIETLAT